jgi:hypothetical protein
MGTSKTQSRKALTRQTYEEIKAVLGDVETGLSWASHLFEKVGDANISIKLHRMSGAIQTLKEIMWNRYIRSLPEDDPLLTWDPDHVEEAPPF